MGIKIQDGFTVETNKPVDDRFTFLTLAARDALDPLLRYEGLKTYVLEDEKEYILKGGIDNADWTEDTGGGGTGSGVVLVEDYPDMFMYPDEDRTEGMIFHVQDTRENWQLVDGIEDENFTDITTTRIIVSNETTRLDLGAGIRREGLEAYQVDTGVTWILKGGTDNANWVYKDAPRNQALASLTNNFTITLVPGIMRENVGIDGGPIPVYSNLLPFGAHNALNDGKEVTVYGLTDALASTMRANDNDGGILGYDVTLGRGQSITYKYSAALLRWYVISTSN